MIGVAELCNKTNGMHFTEFDEEIAGKTEEAAEKEGGNITNVFLE